MITATWYYIWRKKGAEILAKINRARKALDNAQTE